MPLQTWNIETNEQGDKLNEEVEEEKGRKQQKTVFAVSICLASAVT